MRKFSISDKLILASLILSIVTIIIVASYSFYNAREAILDRTFNQLKSVSFVKSTQIESFFENRLKEAKLAASSSDLKHIIDEFTISDKSEGSNFHLENWVNNDFLNQFHKKDFRNISIITNDKWEIQISPKSSIRNIKMEEDSLWNKTIKNPGPIISDLKTSSVSNHHFITISSSIIDDKKEVSGIIIFEISQSAIDSIMLDNDMSNGLGNSGESYMVASDYLMRSSSRFLDKSVLTTVVETESAKRAFEGNTGTAIIDDYRGVKVLSAYTKLNIPNLNWILLTEIDFVEATIPIYRIGNEIVFISIFIFCLVIIVVIILARRITFPLQRLNHAANQIGKGNLDVEIKHQLNDEIGDLTDTFNKMIHRLKNQTEELRVERIKRLSSLFDGQEIERQRLSRELHDSLGQQILAIKMKLEKAVHDDENAKEVLNEAIELSALTAKEIRSISNDLSPAVLSEFGLETALKNLIREMPGINEIDVQFEWNLGIKLQDKTETYIFRICQEALNNINKYSKATKVQLILEVKNGLLNLIISDNGCGFDLNSKFLSKGNGISNIKERVHLLSGNLNYFSEPEKGTFIDIDIPLN